MSIGRAFRTVADVLEEFEGAGFEIVDARTRDSDGRVAVEFRATVPGLDRIDGQDGVELAVDGASVDDGRMSLDVSATVSPDIGDPESAAAEDRLDDDGAAPRSDASPATSTDGDGSTAAAGDDGPQPHRDPEKLRAVYDAHETFAEMTDALGADVTPQTVRRQMIEHGIHEPATSTGSGGPDDPDRAAGTDGREAVDGADVDDGDERHENHRDDTRTSTVAEGIDLPDDTSLDDLKRAVQSSRTVYEVSRTLGADREFTRRLLDELDLLDLVTGRISRTREVTPEEVDRRVQQAAPGSA